MILTTACRGFFVIFFLVTAYLKYMELTYNQLKSRDVINVADGKCLGRIINVKFKFPQGVIVGIFVPGRRTWGLRLFDKSEIFIEESKILKIGGDVILVDLKCADSCAPSVNLTPPKPKPKPCPPPCPPVCGCGDFPNAQTLFGEDGQDADDL